MISLYGDELCDYQMQICWFMVIDVFGGVTRIELVTEQGHLMMQTLAKFNGIRDLKINLIQVSWDLNEFITMEDLLQSNKTLNQLDHHAYT